MVTAALTVVVASASAAQADTCRKVKTPIKDFTVCGAALNWTSKTMHAATLDRGQACTVFDTHGKKLGSMKCTKRDVKPNATAKFRDTDAVMFPSSYKINENTIPGGSWIKIKVAVVCVNPLNTQVRCYGY
ncbi:hypothetical protein AB5J62_22985 [Amycolatopsis sp. cg5]|uniref:hypothetical protein n=1 Tax=Amycolatopsis sp. cg5 TaxID=3238802 RepID=UPI0035256246